MLFQDVLMDFRRTMRQCQAVIDPILIAELRTATRDDHVRLDDDLKLFDRVMTKTGRCELVSAYYRLHSGAEAQLSPWLVDVPGLAFASRLRAPQILEDLIYLGGEIPQSPLAPAIGSIAEAFGWMYVLEGSSLGGRVIHRALANAGVDLQGLGFLHPYGSGTGAQWKAFVTTLESFQRRQPAAMPAVLAGSRAGFKFAYDVLSERSSLRN